MMKLGHPIYKKINEAGYLSDYGKHVDLVYKDREKEIVKYGKLLGSKKDVFIKSCKKELASQYESMNADLAYLKTLANMKETDYDGMEKAYIDIIKKTNKSIPLIKDYKYRLKLFHNKIFNTRITTNYFVNKDLVKTKYEYETQFKQETLNKIEHYTNLGLKTSTKDTFLLEFCEYLKKHKQEPFYKPNKQIKKIQKIFIADFENNIQSYDFLQAFDDELKTKEFIHFCKAIKDKKFLLLLLMFCNQLAFSKLVSEFLSISLNKVFSTTTYFNKLYLISGYLEEVITIIVGGTKVGQHNRLYDTFFTMPISLSKEKKAEFEKICSSRRWRNKIEEYDCNITYERIVGNHELIIPISMKHSKTDEKTNVRITHKRMQASLSQPLETPCWHTIEHYKLWLLKVLCLDGKIQQSLKDTIDIFSTNLKDNSMVEFFKFLKSFIKMNQDDFEKLITHTFIAYIKSNVIFPCVIPVVFVMCNIKYKTFLAYPANIHEEQYYVNFKRFKTTNLKKEIYTHLLKKEDVPDFITYNSIFKEICRFSDTIILLNKNIIIDRSNNAIKHIDKFPRFSSELPAELNGYIL